MGLIERLRDEADLCRNDGAADIAALLDEAVAEIGVLRSANTTWRKVAEEHGQRAKPVPDEWLVKVRRLVQGFEHVSGIARLWEPDYSSGNERALWWRATEACADVAKLLREAEGPNAEAQRLTAGRSE